MIAAPTGTVTLLFTDIEGSSELSEKHEAAFEPVRAAHFTLLRGADGYAQAYEVGTAGDALFLAFADASRAVLWAVAAQRALQNHDWPASIGPVRVRMGIHTGEPYVSEENGRTNYYGPAVNRAARVSGAAHGGQILVSDAARTLAASPVTGAHVTFRDLGTAYLKGVGEERLWQVAAPDLPQSFAPPSVARPQTHNLPASVGAFVGRDTEVADIAALFTNPNGPRLVTLTGFGGMGKTRTAAQAAELCADAFAGGVWWIDLETARDSESLLRRLVEQAQIPLVEGQTVTDQVYTALRSRSRLLLVLDNLEQVENGGSVVRDLLAAVPYLVCLATSRRALGLRIEVVRELRPLPAIAAQSLFVERARSVHADFTVTSDNEVDIAALCRRLEGVPLAVELAAARSGSMTPHQILTRLEEPFRLLQSRAPDLPPRQRALRAAVDWSYDLLSDDDRDVFIQLPVFAGHFTLEDAEAVCDAFDAFESVIALREQSLLLAEARPNSQDMRYLLLDVLRAYAGEKLAERPEQEQATRKRHAERCLLLADAAIAHLRTPQEPDALRMLADLSDNLRAAWQWSARNDSPLRVRLARALGIALQRRGFGREATTPIEDGLQTARTHPAQSTLLAELLRERAGLFLDTNEHERAEQLATEALALSEAAQETAASADARNLLALAARARRDYDTAATLFGEALRVYDASGLALPAAKVRNNLGMIAFEGGLPATEGIAYLDDALTALRRLGDRRGIANVLNNRGNLAFAAEDWDVAARCYTEALEHERILGYDPGIARALNNLGEVEQARGNRDEALRLYTEAITLFDNLQDPTAEYTRSLLKTVLSV